MEIITKYAKQTKERIIKRPSILISGIATLILLKYIYTKPKEIPNIYVNNDNIGKNDKTNVLCIVFAWMGSRPKYIQKYVDMLTKYGGNNDKINLQINTHFTIDTPTWDVNFPQRLYKKANDVINEINEFKMKCNNKKSKIILYAFSNGGGYMLCRLFETINKYNSDIKFDGLILDSLPATLIPKIRLSSYDRTVRAFIPVIDKYNFLLRWTIKSLMHIFLLLSSGCVLLTPKFMIPDMLHKYYEMLINEKDRNILSIPTLFVYSKADSVIYYKSVESFIELKKQALIRKNITNDNNMDYYIRTCKFEDSLHVQHLRMYPNEYIDVITKFIDEMTQ